jgi:hypothetical protein
MSRDQVFSHTPYRETGKKLITTVSFIGNSSLFQIEELISLFNVLLFHLLLE